MINTDSFVLLDDALAAAGVPASRLYENLAADLRCDDPLQLDLFWQQVESAQRAGLHVVVLGDYEWGARLQGLEVQGGCLRVLLFSSLQILTSDAVDAWLTRREAAQLGSVMLEGPAPAGLSSLLPSVSEAGFAEAVDAIHDAIRAGETYQVNFTYRLSGEVFGLPLSLYRRLRARQPVAYGALVALPAGEGLRYVLSCSPELFVEHRDRVLRTRPMKGTAARSGDVARDDACARALAADPKNRAENLMIVDLLRNDMGRVASLGSVRVPALFEVEFYATVLQMTSTIEAQLKPGVGFADILRALFPCGSITGAPKLRTMWHVAQLETRPRRLYTGCIGWVDAPRDAADRVGDFCLSVPIRTLLLDEAAAVDQPQAGSLRVELGIGSGVVVDSEAEAEFQECALKASFATALDPGFALFETLLASAEQGVQHRSQHLARMLASAQTLGFAARQADLEAALDAALVTLPPGQFFRMRLSLSHDGTASVSITKLDSLAEQPLGLLLAPGPLLAVDGLLRHKTTRRALYDQALQRAVAQGCFDMLFYDAEGRISEGARSNLFVLLDGEWWTPPLASGMVLPGTMRGRLLEDLDRRAREAVVTLADLARADRVVLTNALRGVRDAVVRGDPLALMNRLTDLPLMRSTDPGLPSV